jgi:hypothetical protein
MLLPPEGALSAFGRPGGTEMKVLNLRCAHGHGFEGWFASDAGYADQLGRGLVECPLCGDAQIERMPTAARRH